MLVRLQPHTAMIAASVNNGARTVQVKAGSRVAAVYQHPIAGKWQARSRALRRRDDRAHSQPKGGSKVEVARVMSGNGHNRPAAVAAKHVI